MIPKGTIFSTEEDLRPRARLCIIAALLIVVTAAAMYAEADPVRLYLFWQEGCPMCERMKPFLKTLTDAEPGVEVIEKEVGNAFSDIREFRRMATKFGIETPNVPAVFVGTHAWIGYNETICAEISQTVTECVENGCIDAMVDPLPESTPSTGTGTVESRLFGTIELSTLPLSLATVLIAVLDGMNPCSLWVLTFLLGMVLHTGSRGRILLVGMVFLTTTSVIYGLFIVGVVQAMTILSAVRWVRYAVALLAFVMGMINVKDFFAFKRGISLTISAKNQRRIGTRARDLLRADRSAISLAVSTMFMAAGVAIIELPCTAGFPVIWSNLLADYRLVFPVFFSLLLLYLLVYLVDEIVIVAAAAFTLKRIVINENRGRYLKLAGGVVMLVLAAVMVVRPTLLESLQTVAVVFFGSVAIVLIVIAADRFIRSYMNRS